MKSNKYHVALETVGIWDKDNYEMSSSLSLDFINWILGLIKKKQIDDKNEFWVTLRTKSFLESYCHLEGY